MRRYFHPVSALAGAPYSYVIAYPRPTTRRAASRLAELRRLGITRVCFEGPTRLEGIDVLGKGYVGVVILAKMGRRNVALKIRRLDSQRASMKDEARMLGLANSCGVGPKLVSYSRNFLVMEYLEGEGLGKWAAHIGKGDAGMAVRVAREVLEGCYRLDVGGVDHGELSCISKHVLVGKKITIIDFESSSIKRRTSNVTSATQGMFIGSGVSRGMKRARRMPRRDRLIAVLRRYKTERDRISFDAVLEVLGV